jgi:hypothetical protein
LTEDRRTYAFTNLADGINTFSLGPLIHEGLIAQSIDPCNNTAIGVATVANEYIVVGSSGGVISLYDRGTFGLEARLQVLNLTGGPSLLYLGQKSADISDTCAGTVQTLAVRLYNLRLSSSWTLNWLI